MADRPLLTGFRDASVHPGHKQIQMFVGYNPGARGLAGTLTIRDEEWEDFRAHLVRGGWEEMLSITDITWKGD